MNKLLADYAIQVEYPNVSSAEHLETLRNRDLLAEMEDDFSDEERKALVTSDRMLMSNATEVCQELSGFINLEKYRMSKDICSRQWWWYLDVLTYLPESQNDLHTTLLVQPKLRRLNFFDRFKLQKMLYSQSNAII
jgi:hypothetical protein